KINIFGVLGGCAPAYTFMYIEALAKAAQAAGFDPAQALEVAAKMTEGSAKLLASSDDAPETLVKNVCSPGGTTIEGVNSLRKDDLASIVKKAFDASLKRDGELAGS
ncbi:MAG: pyrroline-5-carboxylate reductase, partial [Clostridia bacterium]|nr:pyrroline-5-carboxylate reductase [Clostridia bacterium]